MRMGNGDENGKWGRVHLLAQELTHNVPVPICLRYLYNARQQLVGVADPQGRVTSYERCLCGALKALVDALGKRTSWDQDIQGRTISKTFADGHGYAYGYETTTSRLKTVTDPKSQVSTATYNADNTPAEIDDADSSITYSFDSIYPRLTGMTKTITATSASYATAYTYNPITTTPTDGAGRLATETGPLGSTATIAYTYDELGRVTASAINSVSSGVTYDSLGRITGASNALGSFTYGYSGITPRLTSMSYPNGQSTAYSYQTSSTGDYRLTQINNLNSSSAVISQFNYTYTADGTIATKQEQVDSNTPTLWTYGYDKANQLTSALRTNTSTSAVISRYVYGYDPSGNRTSEQIGLSVTQASYNDLNQRTGSSAGGPLRFTGSLNEPAQVTVGGNAATTSYSTNFTGIASVSTGTNNVPVIATDVNGNAKTNTYQVVIPTGSSISPAYDLNGNCTDNGAGQTYTWDAQNQLLSITYTGGASTLFTYDALGRRIAIVEKNSGGTTTSTKQFVWLGNSMAEERDASNAVTKRFFAQGEQIGGTAYFYTLDHLGSVREMTTSSGTIVARYDYDPYGRVSPVGTVAVDSDFQYAGYYEHMTSALNLTKYRAYDATIGRWLSRDPIAELGGENLYQYVNNNPILLMDEFGLEPATVVPRQPGKPYAKMDDAAINALKNIYPRSQADKSEYSTRIYKNPDGTYDYTDYETIHDPYHSAQPNLPPGKENGARCHTHPTPPSFHSSEEFSDSDRANAQTDKVPAYIMTPQGKIKKYDPSTNTTTVIETIPQPRSSR